jgi:hypothetical protein
MKWTILATLLASSTFVTTVQARMLSVVLDRAVSTPERNVYIATAQACPSTFQSVVPNVRKIGADEAVVDLVPVLDVSSCSTQTQEVRFFVLIDNELKRLGLDPKSAKTYFQLQ